MLTTAALAIELVSKFTEGAWLVVLIIPLFVLLFTRIRRAYDEIGRCSSWARRRPRPSGAGRWPWSRSAACPGSPREAISAALSLADEVVAVTICYHDPEDEQANASFREQWEQWDPDVPLITLRTQPPVAGSRPWSSTCGPGSRKIRSAGSWW